MLDLRDNNVDHGRVEALAGALLINETVDTLNLDVNRMGAASGVALADGLAPGPGGEKGWLCGDWLLLGGGGRGAVHKNHVRRAGVPRGGIRRWAEDKARDVAEHSLARCASCRRGLRELGREQRKGSKRLEGRE